MRSYNSELERDVHRLIRNWLGEKPYELKVRSQIRKPYMEWFYTSEIEAGDDSHVSVLGPFWGETRDQALELLKEQLLHKLAVRVENGE